MLNALTKLLADYLQRRELIILLEPSSIALVASEGQSSRRQLQLLAQWQDANLYQVDPNAQLQQLEQQLRLLLADSKPAGRATRIVLADAWARYFLVTPASNTQSLLDCKASAQMRFQALFGEAPQGWHILGRWSAKESFLTCALPHNALEMVRRVCGEAGRSIVSLETDLLASCQQFSATLGKHNWLLQFAQQQVQIVVIDDGRVQALQSCFIDSQFWQQSDSLHKLLQREALRLQLPYPTSVVLSGRYAPQWQSQVLQETEVRTLPGLSSVGKLAKEANPALHLLHGVLA